MTRRRAATWKDIPSSSELAALVRCEAEFVWERNTGRSGAPGNSRELRSRMGQQVHLKTQQDMERFHNAGRRRAVPAPDTRPAAPAPAPPPLDPILSRGHTAAQVPGGRPSEPRPSTPPRLPRPASDRRCFVASAVYGLDDPRTEELRRFRDARLLPSAVGRQAVRAYYLTSPLLVLVLDRLPLLAGPVHRILDLIRLRLRRAG